MLFFVFCFVLFSQSMFCMLLYDVCFLADICVVLVFVSYTVYLRFIYSYYFLFIPITPLQLFTLRMSSFFLFCFFILSSCVYVSLPPASFMSSFSNCLTFSLSLLFPSVARSVVFFVFSLFIPVSSPTVISSPSLLHSLPSDS